MADDYNFSGLSPMGPASVSELPPDDRSPQGIPQEPTMTNEGYDISGLKVIDPSKAADSLLEDRYGTFGQKLATVAEGAAQGVLGPIAPAIEINTGMTRGLDIRARAQTNPALHTLAESGAFAAAAMFGDEAGLSGVVSKAGEAGSAVLGSTLGKMAAKSATEMATLAASNELSKMVEGDPNQTLGSAAINVGLSGVLGGLGGTLVDRFNPIKYFVKQAIRSKATEGLSELIGRGAAAVAGGALGHAVGMPLLGGLVFEKALGPTFSTLARPLAEKIANLPAAEAAFTYIYGAQQGQKVMQNTVAQLFGKAAQAVNIKDLVAPDKNLRDEVEKTLRHAQNPDNAINLGGDIAHYLPEHTTAVAQLASTALNYFNSLKPVQAITSPLDQTPPVDKSAQVKYNRALDIAQQPLLTVKHIQDGTLLPQDVVTLRTLYPGLHDSMIRSMTDNMIKAKAAGTPIPYNKRVGLNLFMGGHALDSTMTPMAMQGIISSASPQSQMQAAQTQSGGHKGHSSQAVLSQINKVNALSATNSQARQISKRK